jgi:hypothetical protein
VQGLNRFAALPPPLPRQRTAFVCCICITSPAIGARSGPRSPLPRPTGARFWLPCVVPYEVRRNPADLVWDLFWFDGGSAGIRRAPVCSNLLYRNAPQTWLAAPSLPSAPIGEVCYSSSGGYLWRQFGGCVTPDFGALGANRGGLLLLIGWVPLAPIRRVRYS